MWWWTAGWWWPGLLLMAVFMVICMVLMARIMGSTGAIGMCGLGRWREARDRADARRAHAPRASSHRYRYP